MPIGSKISRPKKPQLPPKPSLPGLHKRPSLPGMASMDTAPELLAFKEATRRKIERFSPELRYRIRRALEYVEPGRTEATVPELIEFGEILMRGYVFGADFDFQSAQLGGRAELGGLVADFLFPKLMVVIRVMGGYFHGGLIATRSDQNELMVLGQLGYSVLDLPEFDCYSLQMLINRNDEVLGPSVSRPRKA